MATLSRPSVLSPRFDTRLGEGIAEVVPAAQLLKTGRIRTIVAPLVVFGAITAGTFGTASAAPIERTEVAAVRATLRDAQLNLTRGSSLPDRGASVGSSDARDGFSVQQLKERSGLSWAEFAKAIGVSTRAAHHWVNGAKISAANAERLRLFSGVVRDAEAETPRSTRDRLVSPVTPGQSPLSIFEANGKPSRKRDLADFSIAEFVRADEDDHQPVVQAAKRQSSVKARSASARRPRSE